MTVPCPTSPPLSDLTPETDGKLSDLFWRHQTRMIGFLVTSVVLFAAGVVMLASGYTEAAAGFTLAGWANSYGVVWHRAKSRMITELRFGR